MIYPYTKEELMKHPELETRWVMSDNEIEYLKGLHIATLKAYGIYGELDLYEVIKSDGSTAITFNVGFSEDDWLDKLEPLRKQQVLEMFQ